MNKESADLRWGVERRLEFIEFRLYWEGGINRSDLIEFFGVSVPQASKDLTLYQERAPGNMEYDKREKRYFAGTDFIPRFLSPDPDSYLSRLRSLAEGMISPAESWLAYPPDTDIALTPKRKIDADALREVLNAVRDKRSLDIYYQSMNEKRPDPIWRRITPHAFGYDSFRWHTRAFCHLEGGFKDFLLPRILDVGKQGEPGADGDQDRLWHEYVEIEIAPHPKLADGQKKVVAKDYGMTDGKAVLSVRCAMLFYVLKRLGLLGDAEKENPRRQHIVAINKNDVLTALERTNSVGEIAREPSKAAAGAGND